MVNRSGNIGIGTTAPAATLDIFTGSGTNQSLNQIRLKTSHPSYTTYGRISDNYDGLYLGQNAYHNGTGWVADDTGKTSSRIELFGNASDSFILFYTTPTNNNPTSTERMRIDKNGNVGIGTTNPAYGKLQVNKSIRIDDDSGSTTGSDTVGASPYLYLGTTTAGGLFQFNGAGGVDLWQVNGSWGRTVTFAKTGNVGIGTTSPTEKLHVSGNGKITGNLTVDGNIAAKYQDVAEWVPASEQLSAGTVVVLDSTKSNQVISSSQSYDTRVAGVVSAQPGIALGESGDGKVLVATTGRVRVKVDASRAPIHIGDLLVTSDIPGLAMKSEPIMIGVRQMHSPGTLIGKALEPLEKGSGTILVLLSLQ